MAPAAAARRCCQLRGSGGASARRRVCELRIPASLVLRRTGRVLEDTFFKQAKVWHASGAHTHMLSGMAARRQDVASSMIRAYVVHCSVSRA